MSSDASHPSNMFANNVPETMPMSNQPPTFAPPSALFKPTSQLAQMDAKPVTMDSGAGSGFDPTWLECSILSSMLHDADSGLVSSDSPDVPTAPAMELMDSYTHVNNVLPHELRNDDTLAPHLSWNAQHPPMQPMLQKPVASEFGDVHVYPEQGMGEPSHAQRLMGPAADSMSAPHAGDMNATSSLEKVNANKRPDESAGVVEHDSHNDSVWKQRVADVYRGDTKPFRYTEGYHILLKYVTQKYEKSDVLRIVRALAIFRPSLIALQMALSEEDEKFVERAFQRTMLEFEKLISFSGTPTVVWRRTCEICVVGAEFCMLTQWSKEDLLGKYMYQFMDKDSVLNYWEQFASHAFENTTPSVMTTCVLLNPSGKRIPCTWCFTIKRDPFDLPAYVVGNFLPILS
ncbi:Transcriptional regulator of nonfermentable carbon utilization [Malassezia brasiliensis]|uniref:Transcriptional regulator of nonfermentable carbon utilization n=1 Tax=Malassezia brasiliensis TaxID=1821822 RepID=A0AAF0DVJ5_9BASI|nr:Transcriptional regulator of nonfermentable carbon utilization [Malassezia brasiliensis]